MAIPEKQRVYLQRDARRKAENARYQLRLGTHGKIDIFHLLFLQGILHIRKPMGIEENRLSGFISKMNGLTVVCTNSSKSLGHEFFAATHELYHFLYDLPKLKERNWKHISHAGRFMLQDEESEYVADQFAVHFLMPEEAVYDTFERSMRAERKHVRPEHVLIMQQQFNVSYDAMLLRLLECELMDEKTYQKLKEFGQDTEWLCKIAQQEGLPISLLMPSSVYEIPQSYLHMIRMNYEREVISFTKLESILNMIGKTPQDYGYFPKTQVDLSEDEDAISTEYLSLVDDLLEDTKLGDP